MIDNYFRKILPKYSKSLVSLLAKYKVTPNQITIFAFAVSSLSAVFLSLDWPYLAVFTWWAGRLCDGLDGILARHIDQTSSFGAYLDIVCDMAVYSFMVLGFFTLYPHLSFEWLVVLVGYVLCITSALSLGSVEAHAGSDTKDDRGLRLGAGLAEAGETGIAYTLMILLPQYIAPIVYTWILILFITVVSRTVLARKFS